MGDRAIMEFIGLCLVPPGSLDPDKFGRAAGRVGDWARCFELSAERMVSGLVWSRLLEAGLEGGAGPEAGAMFEELRRRSAIENALRLGNAAAAVSRMEGDAPLFFKGSALLLRGAYSDFGQRLMSDVDLLSRESWREEIESAFLGSGLFAGAEDQLMEDWEVRGFTDDWGSLVEVHWSLQPHNGARSGAAEERLFGGSEFVEWKGRRLLVPSWEDCFIQAALHSTSHHYFDTTYLFVTVADLGHILLRSEGLDWDRVAEGLFGERMLEHAAVAVMAGELLTGLAFFASAFSELEARRPGVGEVAGPLASSLVSMSLRPESFHSFYERRFLAPKGLGGWWRYLAGGIGRRLGRNRGGDVAPGPDGLESGPPRRRNFFDRAGGVFDPGYLRYLLALWRFDRRIGFVLFSGESRGDE